jgi:hypothetical protein
MYRFADEGQFLPKNASISATELSFSVLNHFSNILRLPVPLSYVDECCRLAAKNNPARIRCSCSFSHTTFHTKVRFCATTLRNDALHSYSNSHQM